MKAQHERPDPAVALRSRITDLEDALRLLEEERSREIRRRRRNLLLLGVLISLVVHLGIVVYLDLIRRAVPGGSAVQAASIEFAVLPQEELTHLEELRLDDLAPDLTGDPHEQAPSDVVPFDPDPASSGLDASAAGSVPALGGSGAGSGSGSGSGSGLGGGGAGATFFGVGSRGTRFAYIVDVSGSMGQNRKLEIAMRELARSIESLPDYAWFYVVLFSSEISMPRTLEGWTRAKPSTTSTLIRWLNQVDPGGGTQPAPAFHQAFSLDRRPDAIFFLTDGLMPPDIASIVADLNGRGRRVVINTIAFGDPAGQDQLKEIARQSGGVYRFVPSEQW